MRVIWNNLRRLSPRASPGDVAGGRHIGGRDGRLSFLLAAAMLPLALAGAASAADQYFIAPSGSWGIDSNWVDSFGTPSTHPGTGDTASRRMLPEMRL